MPKVLESFDVSATRSTESLSFRDGIEFQQAWIWEVTCPSGTGGNLLQIDLVQLVNLTGVTTTDVPINNSDSYKGPREVHSDLVDAAPGGRLHIVDTNTVAIQAGRIDFTYTGAGSRTFRVKLRTGVT